MKRRDFLLGSAALISVSQAMLPQSLSAIDPIVRPKPGQLRLSLAAYSMRKYLDDSKGNRSMDLFEFVDFCYQLGLPGTETDELLLPQGC